MTSACQLGASNQRKNIRQINADLFCSKCFEKEDREQGHFAGGRPLVCCVNFTFAHFCSFFLRVKSSVRNFFKKMLSSIPTIMPKEVILPETIDSYRDSIMLPLPLEARSSFVSWVTIVGRGSRGILCPLTSHWPWVWLQQLRNGVWVLAAHHSTQTLLPAGGCLEVNPHCR